MRQWGNYCFPGNVRELRNIVIRLATKYAGQTVNLEQLESELDIAIPADADPADSSLLSRNPETLQELAKKQLQRQTDFSLDDTLRLWEQGYIEAALRLTHGNVSQAARLLGVNRTTLYSRIEAAEKEQK